MRGARQFSLPDQALIRTWNDSQFRDPSDTRMKRLIRWTRATRQSGADDLQDPPFERTLAAEHIAVVWNDMNRVANALLVESPLPQQA